MMTDKKKKDTNLVDGLFHDMAEDEATRGKLTDHARAEVDEAKAMARSAIQDARNGVLEDARRERLAAKKPSLPTRILSMTKEAIVDRLRELERMYPGQLVVQHRKLEDTPLDDLRSLLADFEAQIERSDDK